MSCKSEIQTPNGGLTIECKAIATRLACYTLTEKRVPKQYLWGAIATNSTLFFQRGAFFSLIIAFAKTVPLGTPNYGQPNSTPRGAVSAPFLF